MPPRRMSSLLVALLALCVWAPAAHAAPALNFTSFSAGAFNADGSPSSQAGAHPFELTTSFSFGTVLDPRAGSDVPAGSLKDTAVELPAGAIGDPSATPQCSQRDMNRQFCPIDTQVGYVDTDLRWLFGRTVIRSPVYNMVPPAGQPAQFAFVVVGAWAHIDVKVRSDGDYGVTATVHNANAGAPLYSAAVHLWGVPADSSHDAFRAAPPGSAVPISPGPSHLARKPFLRNPTSCGGALTTTIHATSWQEPDQIASASSTTPAMSGCQAVPFAPAMSATPDTKQASSPAGLAIDLHLPQSDNPDGLATSDLKKVVMRLPAGVAINSSAADGLASCSDSDFGLKSTAIDNCPTASKIGSLQIETPLLEDPLEGSLFLASPLEQSPAAAAAGRMYRLFIEAEGAGTRIKLAGSVVPDPVTGQLTATFDDNPQLPFEDLHLELASGPRAPLSTPKACGTYITHAELTPWARPTEPVGSDSSFTIDEDCAKAGRFTPGLEAGTVNPTGGAFSPFLFRVTRPDGQQNLAAIEATLPEGVLAKLAGVPLCAAAAAASGNCSAASQVGTTTVAAGTGPSPVFVPQPGRAPTAVYLSGPYKGAPLSLAVKVPAQAGPFDLGDVTVRNALYVDPVTAQVTVKSDPLPQILDGVPVSYRDIRVAVDRPAFTLNPTSCEPKRVTSTLTSIEGATASPADRFQAGDCSRLGFKPGLKFDLEGGTKRGRFPALKATVTYPKGNYANIARAAVSLPHSEFLEQGHIRTICTRVQFAADQCPPASVYGKARAITPLLDKPLEGPVYLRSSSHPLPDLVADLNGQIHVVLAGRIDSVKGQIRSTFDSVPDAPVSKFVLEMQGGRKGLLVNSTNLCKSTNRATVKLDGQNGKTHDFNPVVTNGCKGSGKKKP